MSVTIETANIGEIEKLLQLLKNFQHLTLNVVDKTATPTNSISVRRGDKSIDPTELFGMWEEKPRSLETIRGKG